MAKVVLDAEDGARKPIHGSAIASGVTIVEGDLLGIDSSGNVVLATAASGGNIHCRGFAIEDKVQGAFGNTRTLTRMALITVGKVGGYSGLTPGNAVFLGIAGDTIPYVTQTEPTTGKLRQVLGYATSATEIMFNINNTFTVV